MMDSFAQQENCPVCGSASATTKRSGTAVQQVDCGYCGTFEITDSASASWSAQKRSLSPRQLTNIQAWLRESQGIRIDSYSFERLMAIPMPTVGERAEKLLIALSKRAADIGANVNLGYGNKSEELWLSVSWSTSNTELRFLVQEYLIRKKGWLAELGGDGTGIVKITPDGFDHLEQLRMGGRDSQLGFCAMWFAKDMSALWTDAIEPAIKDAGYKAVRIDGVEHNNKIDDEILANIRRAKFVIADFTGHRGGVYFEAGFALGLGRQVIWTVREDALKDTHFDNRQYNFLQWKSDDLPDFKRRLQLRIEATIGRGPL